MKIESFSDLKNILLEITDMAGTCTFNDGFHEDEFRNKLREYLVDVAAKTEKESKQVTRKLKSLDTITREEISRRMNDHEVAIAIIDGVETRFEMKTGHVLATSTESLRQWQENMNARAVPRGKETRIDEAIDAIYNARSSLQFIDIDPEV